MRVCYFGKYDENYDRNAIIRSGLEANGVEVVQVRIDQGYLFDQYRQLWQAAKLTDESVPDAIIVAEFNQFVTPLARMLAYRWRIPLLFDPLISVFETAVHDRRRISAGSMQAKRQWLMDWLAFRLVDVLIADTSQHQAYYHQEFGIAEKRTRVVPVGAQMKIFHPCVVQKSRSDDGILVLFWGSYIPLQGVETIVKAAELVSAESSIRFVLVGAGQTYADVRELASSLAVHNISFMPWLSRAGLARHIAAADICLGIFGATQKARRVVPNKVFQALAMAKPVITGDSPAVREFFTAGEHLHIVPLADPDALADALRCLASEPSYRNRLAANGHETFLANFTPSQIGLRMREVLESVL